MMTKIINNVSDLREALNAWRKNGETIGFVPTMGALHAGHLALVKQAKVKTKHTVVSIFVNPLQFGPNEDLEKYPRDLEKDRQLLNDVGCDLVFAPTVQEMYSEGFVTKVDPGPLQAILEGAVRPGHFVGVATVVAKLFMQVMPHAAFFGEKDYQQLLVIRQVVRDLSIPIEIVGVPIVRDTDGLALSSRNVYLTAEERKKALALPQTLADVVKQLKQTGNVQDIMQKGRDRITAAGFMLDYLELRDAGTLEAITTLSKPARLLAAAKIGTTRLIDNLAVEAG